MGLTIEREGKVLCAGIDGIQARTFCRIKIESDDTQVIAED